MGNAITGSTPKRMYSNEFVLKDEGFRIYHMLGEGEYSKVYLSEYTKNDTTVLLACKVTDTEKNPTNFIEKFFPRELEILINIQHPHIIQTHSIFKLHTKYYIFTQYAKRGDLLQYMEENGAIVEDQARLWIYQLALAMQYLENLQIAHRDIKAENVLITEKYNVKLADFGFARRIDSSKMSSTYCCSLIYVSPEILRGEPYNPFISDLFSLGVLLYVALNKASPFVPINAMQLQDDQMNRRWSFRIKILREVTPEVVDVVGQLMEPDVTKRWTLKDLLDSKWILMESKEIKKMEADS